MIRTNNNTLPILAGLICLALALRLAALGVPEFWYDEAFSVLITRLPWAPMITATAGDTHPPLFYLLAWLWSRLVGQSEFQFRLLSVLASVAALPLVWRVMDRLNLSDPTRWAVLALMALGPFQVYFGQEARMYALLQLAVLAGVLGVLERRWWLFGLANLSLFYLHNYGVFYVPVLAALALYQERRLTPGLALAVGLPVLGYLPWAAVLGLQINTIESGYWIEPVTLGQIIYTLTIFLFGPFTRQYVMAGVLVAVGALVYALIRLAEGYRDAPHKWMATDRLIILYLGSAPLILSVLASVLIMPVYLYRGLIGCAPFLYMLILQPLADLQGWRRVLALSLVASMAAVGLAGYWLDIRGFKSQTMAAAQVIQQGWQDGDIIYSTSDGQWVMFTLYQDHPVYLMPQCEEHDRGALSELTRQALGVPVADLANIPHQRAWVIWSWGPVTSACNLERANQLITDQKPLLMVSASELVEAGLWLIENR